MNLLLILSALMTALTGAITGVRTPEVRLYQASSSIARERRGGVARVRAIRPLQPLATLVALARRRWPAARPLQPVAPRYLERLRV